VPLASINVSSLRILTLFKKIAPQETCCQFSGTWDLGHCATDADCGPPVKNTNTIVVNVTQKCCATCNQNYEKFCGQSAAGACDACTTAIPCSGYATSKTENIASAEGGIIELANGAGMAIPKNVWPEGVSDVGAVPCSGRPLCPGADFVADLCRLVRPRFPSTRALPTYQLE
jgi:hypothetical protein